MNKTFDIVTSYNGTGDVTYDEHVQMENDLMLSRLRSLVDGPSTLYERMDALEGEAREVVALLCGMYTAVTEELGEVLDELEFVVDGPEYDSLSGLYSKKIYQSQIFRIRKILSDNGRETADLPRKD